jgi:hypothetical protein
MERDALIKYLLENTQPGEEIAFADGSAVYPKIKIAKMHVTVPKNAEGRRWAVGGAKTVMKVMYLPHQEFLFENERAIIKE